MPVSEHGFQLRAGTQGCRGRTFLTAAFAAWRPEYAGGGGEQPPQSFLQSVCPQSEGRADSGLRGAGFSSSCILTGAA